MNIQSSTSRSNHTPKFWSPYAEGFDVVINLPQIKKNEKTTAKYNDGLLARATIKISHVTAGKACIR
jgi:hypothetical protein